MRTAKTLVRPGRGQAGVFAGGGGGTCRFVDFIVSWLNDFSNSTQPLLQEENYLRGRFWAEKLYVHVLSDAGGGGGGRF